MFDDVVSFLTMVGTLVAAGAILFAWSQLKAARKQAHISAKQAQTSFEDDLSREYRAIIGSLPAEAFYKDSTVTLDDDRRRAFYRYFDLSNEELFYVRLGRVSAETATQWRQGIRGNISGLPSFGAAWIEIADRVPADFLEDLRELIPPESLQLAGPLPPTS